MTVLVAALFVFVSPVLGRAEPVMMDAIDLHAAIIHNSPSDVADWPIAAPITKLTMAPTGAPNEGLSFESSVLNQWPDYTPPGWGGPIEYTVWACANVEGGWHCAGFIQMWRGRVSTGAPMLMDWNKNWAYDANRWGALADFVPTPGSTMAYFLTAGNARGVNGVTSLRSRTTVVSVTLPAGDTGTFAFSVPVPTTPTATPTPIAIPTSTAAPALAIDYSALLQQILALEQQQLKVAQDTNAQVATINTSFGQFLKDLGSFSAKYLAPAVAAFVAAKKL